MLRLTCLLCAGTLGAQSIIYTHPLTAPQPDIATGGDLDADGVPDYVIRYAGATPGIQVFSGRTGRPVRAIRADVADELGRYMTILADVDGDGASDLLVGAPADATNGANSGAAHVLSGRTLQRLVSYIGISAGDGLGRCSALGDVDGDTTADYVIASPFSDFPGPDAGAAYVVSGRTGNILRSHLGSTGRALGEFLIGVDDQDNDGRPDYAISSRAVGGGHALEVFSGRTGLRLFTNTLPATNLTTLTRVGDVDNDGRNDIGVGLPNDGPNGRILVLSGAGFGVLLSYAGSATGAVGNSLTGVGDVNGDRRADLAITRGPINSPRIVVISGANGVDLVDLGTVNTTVAPSIGLASPGDIDGDGRADVIVSPADPTNARAFATERLRLTTFSHTARLTNVNQNFTMNFGPAFGGDTYLLLASFSGTSPGLQFGPVNVPVNFDAMTQFSIGSANRPPYTTTLGTLSPSGSAIAQLLLGFPAPPELAGLTMHHAVVVFRNNQVVGASNAVPLTFLDFPGGARAVTETFTSSARMDRARSGGLTFGGLGRVGGSGVHGDFDYRLGTDRGNGVYEFDLQRDTRNGVRGFVIPASNTLTGAEAFITDGTFQFATLEVPAGIRVRFLGTTPARLLVRGQINIAGTLDASGVEVAQYSSVIPGLGQPGGQAGPGGGRGGKGADTHGGTGAPVDGEHGQDVQVAATHGYAGRAAGTGGRGAPQFPAGGNAAVTHTLSNICMQVAAGGGGGGFTGAGSAGRALLTPSNLPADLGPDTPGGTSFQLFPIPAGASSASHFLVGGSGGGGGGSHSLYHTLTRPFIWKSGMAGSGGGGALLLRAGAEITSAATGSLVARGGNHFPNYQNLIQGPPGPGGGGSGGSIVVQSAVRAQLQGLVDVGGGTGAVILPGATQLLNFRMQGGDGAPGFYRVEAPTAVVANGNPPVASGNVATAMADQDLQAGQQSLFYATGAPFAATFVRFEIDALINGTPVRFGDTAGSTPRFGDPAAALWFKLQAADVDIAGNAIPGTQGPWRDAAAQLTGDGGNAFRFVLVANAPNVQVTAVRVFVTD